MFGQNIEQSIYDTQQSIHILKTLKGDIETYAHALTVEDVLDLIEQQIRAANQKQRSFMLAKKLDLHLPDTARAALINT
ncbi:hypothetical protein LG198_11460 [Methylobacillus arboreus]|uniref:hypothetical protein n=1 Tax=Methylobacillus arboreus TaxID=755170 RepID=UPI001E2E9C2F|nr:hypothetical protein [Methylobacillus arboreus]MCB5191345.1 hypothetical protein [Methylobacillus arboreus]